MQARPDATGGMYGTECAAIRAQFKLGREAERVDEVECFRSREGGGEAGVQGGERDTGAGEGEVCDRVECALPHVREEAVVHVDPGARETPRLGLSQHAVVVQEAGRDDAQLVRACEERGRPAPVYERLDLVQALRTRSALHLRSGGKRGHDLQSGPRGVLQHRLGPAPAADARPCPWRWTRQVGPEPQWRPHARHRAPQV